METLRFVTVHKGAILWYIVNFEWLAKVDFPELVSQLQELEGIWLDVEEEVEEVTE